MRELLRFRIQIGRVLAQRIAGARLFDLDDLRAVRGEQQGTVIAGEVVVHREDPDAGERTVTAVLCHSSGGAALPPPIG